MKITSDVTLVSDDNEQIASHKLVLLTCTFKSIFMMNKYSNPLFCLEGLILTDVRNMMDYTYSGELQIFQDVLNNVSCGNNFQILLE